MLTQSASRRWWVTVGLITVTGTASRLWGIERKWLWWDELLSANFAFGDFLSSLTEALRFDTHPPLYYLQLHVWMALGGTSDQWLMLNPVAWSIFGIVSTAWVARRIHGDSAGWFAGALYAVMVGSVIMAVQVRMYAMISTLAVWAFWFHRRTARGEGRTLSHLSAIVAETGIAASHGAGFLMLSGIFAYGLWTSIRRGLWQPWLRWRVLSAGVLVPCMAFAWLKRNGVGHPISPDLADIWAGLQWFVVNPSGGSGSAPWQAQWTLAAAGIWLAWVWLAARDPESRAIAVFGVVLPITVFVVVSHLFRAVWLPRNLAVVFPFFCLAASGATAVRRPGVRIVGGMLVGVMAVSTAFTQIRAQKGDDFKPAAELTRRLTEPGDLIIFYGVPWDWFCFSWYHRGPDWGDPLAEQAFNRTLPDLAERFNLSWARRLFLHDEVNESQSGGARVTTEFHAPEGVAEARRIIRVISAPSFSTFSGRKLPPVGGRVRLDVRHLPGGDVSIEVWR